MKMDRELREKKGNANESEDCDGSKQHGNGKIKMWTNRKRKSVKTKAKWENAHSGKSSSNSSSAKKKLYKNEKLLHNSTEHLHLQSWSLKLGRCQNSKRIFVILFGWFYPFLFSFLVLIFVLCGHASHRIAHWEMMIITITNDVMVLRQIEKRR